MITRPENRSQNPPSSKAIPKHGAVDRKQPANQNLTKISRFIVKLRELPHGSSLSFTRTSALVGSRGILCLPKERENLRLLEQNRELPFQELSSHFMLLLKAEPLRFTGTPRSRRTKKGAPARGSSLCEANDAQTLAYRAFLASIAAWPAARRASGTR